MKPSKHWIPKSLATLALLTFSSLGQAQEQSYQVRAKKVFLGDGTHLENGLVVVRDGKILSVGAGDKVDPKLPLFEHDGVLTPGLVACQSTSGTLGGADDRTRSVLPEARVADSVVLGHSDFDRALAAGITTMVLAPSAANLSGGITTVVKTCGGVTLKREGHLAISFSNAALGRTRGSRFRGALNGSLENTNGSKNGTRLPTSYAGAKRMLADLMADQSNPGGAFARAGRGELPVLLTAWDRNEVVRAASFAKQYGLGGALRGAPLGGEPAVLKALQKSGLGVIVGPFGMGQSKRTLESARLMAEAGIPLAFALDAPANDPVSFRLSAAMAATVGANPDALLSSMTSVGARLAGVDQRVGAIKAGLDADFVLWSGHPVNLASSVQAVYVDGKQVYRQAQKDGQAR